MSGKKQRNTLLSALLLLASTPMARADDPKQATPSTFRVPYRLTGTNHVLVRVKINGKGPYNFILDTGAPALFVMTGVCEKLGIKPGPDGWGTFDRFEVEGGVVMKRVRGRVEDPFQLKGMNGLGVAGVELHGMIGYNLLARSRITFDFTKNKLLWEPLNYNPPPPQGLGQQGVAGGLDALGTFMELVGKFLGKPPQAEIKFPGYLGVGLEEVAGKLRVRSVLEKSPAAMAGIQAGDELQALGDRQLTTAADLRKGINSLAMGESAKLKLVRKGETQTLEIKPTKGI